MKIESRKRVERYPLCQSKNFKVDKNDSMVDLTGKNTVFNVEKAA